MLIFFSVLDDIIEFFVIFKWIFWKNCIKLILLEEWS